jgi:hypothetical protein
LVAPPAALARWKVQPPAAHTPTGDSSLSGVSGVSTTACVAVGFSAHDAPAEHWDGVKLSIETLGQEELGVETPLIERRP